MFGIKSNFLSSATMKRGPYMVPLDLKTIDEDTLRNKALFGCSKEINHGYAGYWCGGLIQYNNWKIPDDYPVKF